jgi:hypothetical protein
MQNAHKILPAETYAEICAYLLSMHQNKAIESYWFIVGGAMSSKSNISHRWMFSAQLYTEHIYILSLCVEEVSQLVSETVCLAALEVLRL